MSQRDLGWGAAAETNSRALESAVRELLADFGAQGVRFRKDCGWSVRGLVAAALLGLWAVLLHAWAERRRCDETPPGPVSPDRVLRALRRAIDEAACRPEPGESLAELLAVAVVAPYRRRDKTSRGYPHRKYESPTRPPRLVPATAAQRELAKELAPRTTAKGVTA